MNKYLEHNKVRKNTIYVKMNYLIIAIMFFMLFYLLMALSFLGEGEARDEVLIIGINYIQFILANILFFINVLYITLVDLKIHKKNYIKFIFIIIVLEISLVMYLIIYQEHLSVLINNVNFQNPLYVFSEKTIKYLKYGTTIFNILAIIIVIFIFEKVCKYIYKD